jgi:aminoglycoside 2'-N-acetyltransferase I
MSSLFITIQRRADLAAADHAAIIALCSLAYEEDFAPIMASFPDPVHVIGRVGGAIVSHAAFIERWLQPAGLPLLRCAYVEAVATLPTLQHRGHATKLLAALPPLWHDFDIAGLAPSDPGFYARLGWESWRGPMFVRTPAGLEATPNEEVMVLRLPRTPALDLDAAVSIEWRADEVW